MLNVYYSTTFFQYFNKFLNFNLGPIQKESYPRIGTVASTGIQNLIEIMKKKSSMTFFADFQETSEFQSKLPF